MNIPFLDNWRRRHGMSRGVAVMMPASSDTEGVAQLLSECELLRGQARAAGFELEDTPASLAALDQLMPLWRDGDPEVLARLGNDAGLYLGTVVVRTVPGARWQVWPNGRPVVRLASGREIDVVAAGRDWVFDGAPELSQVYAEASEA
ncbi:DUF6278 family protein [Streptomyces desertarenae]|uniref:DUF6278 family protein n=1 Tax=Streptomyces desertarenae TaxID=2666184 RepID=A0ABW4PKR5_9ACTN